MRKYEIVLFFIVVCVATADILRRQSEEFSSEDSEIWLPLHEGSSSSISDIIKPIGWICQVVEFLKAISTFIKDKLIAAWMD